MGICTRHINCGGLYSGICYCSYIAKLHTVSLALVGPLEVRASWRSLWAVAVAGFSRMVIHPSLVTVYGYTAGTLCHCTRLSFAFYRHRIRTAALISKNSDSHDAPLTSRLRSSKFKHYSKNRVLAGPAARVCSLGEYQTTRWGSPNAFVGCHRSETPAEEYRRWLSANPSLVLPCFSRWI